VRAWCRALPLFGALVAVVTAVRAQQPAPPRLSFAEAIRRAFVRNPDALVAVEEIARAKAIVEEVRATSLPTLAASAAFTQLDAPRRSEVNPSVVILPQTQFNATGAATLSLSPQRWVLWAQARENLKLARLDAAQVRRLLAIAVGQTYLALLAQHQVVDADDNGVRNAAAHVEYTHARLVAGNGTVLDYERANALFHTDRTQLENARFGLTRLQEQLGILIGENGPVDVTEALQLPPLPADFTVALGDAQRLRSDLRLSRETLVAATQVRRDSWADYVPWAAASFDLFYQTPPTQTLPRTGWQLTVTLGFSIYDGGLRYGLLKERRAREHEARIRLDGQLRLVDADVRTATVELERARSALVSAREAARLWADTLRLTIVSYRAGLSTNIEVIDAQLAALNADIAAALAENNERQAELDLLLASGRFP